MEQTKNRYSRREWLNPGWSSFTGSVVGWVGPHGYPGGERTTEAVLEVADCHSKVRLHGCLESVDDRAAFSQKMRKLSEVAIEMAEFVEAMEGGTT